MLYEDIDGYYRIRETAGLLHRKIVGLILGRKLKKDEVVHHIDRNKLNNSPKNLIVITQGIHEAIHNAEDCFSFEVLADGVKDLPDKKFFDAISVFKQLYRHKRFSVVKFRDYCGR